MKPAQNASPAPTGSTTIGSGMAGADDRGARGVGAHEERTRRPELQDGHGRPEREA